MIGSMSHRGNMFLGRKGSRSGSETAVLQITSMADIFTIILVFLLKTFSTGVSNITPPRDVVLPSAVSTATEGKVKESQRIEISPTSIAVDEKTVTQMQAFRFAPTDLEGDGSPRSLNSALIGERSKEKERKVESTEVMILADRKTPYRTLRTVIAAAAQQGYGDFRLVVVGEQ